MEDRSPERGRSAIRRACLRGVLVGLVVALLVEGGRVLLGANLHAVVPGMVYRSAQLSGPNLERVLRQHGIRTVVNFRGCCAPVSWYLEECRAVRRAGASLEDLSCSSGRLPPVPIVRRLIEVLDRAELPILFHCQQGVDRTGWASAVTLLLLHDCSVAEARTALSFRYLHLDMGKTANMGRFFELYEGWLGRVGRRHTREAFRHWALNEYTAGPCRARLELLEPGPLPLRVPRGRPFSLRVRCWNTSSETWRLHPASNAGIHAVFLVYDEAHGNIIMERSGLFHAEVPPGGSIDLTLPIRALHAPGRYLLRVDMADEQHAFFWQEGSEPLELEMEVP